MNQIENAEKALKLIAARPARIAWPGGLVATWRRCRGRRSGPYYYFRCHTAGHRQSIYLGGEGPSVERVVGTAPSRLGVPRLANQRPARPQVRRFRGEGGKSENNGLGYQKGPIGQDHQGVARCVRHPRSVVPDSLSARHSRLRAAGRGGDSTIPREAADKDSSFCPNLQATPGGRYNGRFY
jgi:hypothetical protein